ncbi:MAG: hypothetical protein AB8H86_27100 [Polyangiales bacterium]
MKATSASCEKCGADLPATLGRVECKYCGKETLLGAGGATTAIPSTSVPGSAGRIVLFAATVLALGIGSMVVKLAGENEVAGGAGDVHVDTSASLQSQVCLLDDLNGDGVREIAALLALDYNAPRLPTILNGATGDTHWQGDALPSSTKLFQVCLGGSWVGIADNDAFSLTLINASTPTQQVRHALSDEVEMYGADESCFSFHMNDERNVGFSARDGSPAECDVVPGSHVHVIESTTCGIISTMPEGATFDENEVTYRVRGRQPGTAFLEVKATRGERDLWDQTLRLMPAEGERIGCFAAAATPGALVVLGSPRGDQHHVVALGLDAESGTERYATEFESLVTRVRGIHYNGRYVVFGLTSRLVALDPLSGEVAW